MNTDKTNISLVKMLFPFLGNLRICRQVSRYRTYGENAILTDDLEVLLKGIGWSIATLESIAPEDWEQEPLLPAPDGATLNVSRKLLMFWWGPRTPEMAALG